jgi:acyl-CoA thioesterase-2
MGDLEVDTRLEPVAEGRYRAALSPDWEIWGPNGGYIASIALRAAGQLANVQRPAAFAGHFLSVARFDEVDVTVRVVRAGRRAESLHVSISQDARPVFEGLVRTAAEVPGLEHDVAEIPETKRPPDLEFIQDLLPPDSPGTMHSFWNNFQVKPAWPERVSETERKAYAPIFREWIRMQPRATFDDPWLDAARSLLMIDTISWIAACQPHPNSAFTAPNLDVTAWFHRAEPESEWLLTDSRCDIAEAGLMGTHARIWSETGRLLASGGAQLFCVPNPASSGA